MGDSPEGIAVTPAGPPSATIAQPTSGAVYTSGQHVATRFSCTDAPNGPGIRRCVDSNGAIAGSGTLQTATVGSYVYSVTATSVDGQTATRSIHYTVTRQPPSPPTASIRITPGTAGPTYHLSGADSTAPGGHHLTHYAWTSAGQPIGIGRAITHTFDAAGQPYPITLSVTDDQRQTASATTTLTPHLETAHVSAVVHFARNQAALTAAARRMLRPLRAQATYAKMMTLTGYCAAREVSRHRLLLKLSRQRAQTVRTYLFSGDRRRRHNVVVRGEGAAHFIAPNTTAAGRTRNRRAAIRITYSKPTRSR